MQQKKNLITKTQEFIYTLLSNLPQTKKELEKIKRKEKYVENNILLLKVYREGIESGIYEPNKKLFELFQKQRTRSLSGITAITILLKPWGCQGKCVYCPTEARMPKSYLSGEPAVMRAILNRWDAKKQVKTRIKALFLMGHTPNKNEMIILGGTWQNYPKDYREEFIKRMYDGLNGKTSKTIEEAQKYNETVENRAIGLSLETRPDCVTQEEVIHMKFLGATKIELGVQTVFDDVLSLIKRGHNMESVYNATKLLKDAGFKVHYHIMPNLPGSTLEKDREMFDILFENENLKPDMLKIYPCVVLENTELINWQRKGKFQVYKDSDLVDLLVDIKQKIPRYCRIMRLGRDIPACEIAHGNKVTNIREIVRNKMEEQNKECQCIRCREVGFRDGKFGDVTLRVEEYDANGGKEYFLEMHDKETNTLFAFTRLRIPSQYFTKEKHFISELEGCAIIRELHTYGQVVAVGYTDGNASQHRGYGKKLLEEAEKIVRKKYQLKKLAVISGIGVRDYYRKIGYSLEGLYMVKNI